MKIKLEDQFTDFFDDIWVYSESDSQSCYMWAVNNEDKTHTPITHAPVIADSYNYVISIMLMPKDSCNWVLRNSLDKETAEIYMDKISTLIRICESINWGHRASQTIDSPLKLSQMI